MGGLSADYFTVTPSPLEVVGGKVATTITGKFPEKYFKKKVTVTVTPYLVYEGGETAAASYTYQGEKVKGNNQTISYKLGGNITMKASFDYIPQMRKSDLYLAFKVQKGSKSYDLPRVKVAEGVLATAEISNAATVKPALAADKFQRIINESRKADILFLIQQANIRANQLSTDQMKEFHNEVANAASAANKELKGINISSYASPDGGVELNTKLAENREKNTVKYMNEQLKKGNIETDMTAEFTAQDWEGFKELVEKSNIQDWMFLGLVQADIVNASMNSLQRSTILLVGAVVLCIAALLISFIIQKGRINLRKKDTEILYRDELFQKLSMNVDDVFLMLDAKTYQADYVSPNAEKLLGITVEQIRKDICILGKLHPEEQEDSEKNYMEKIQVHEQREWDFEYVHLKTGEKRWFHNIVMGSEVNGKRKYILVMSDRTSDWKMNQALSEAVHAAETANQAKSTFLSNMSHDIRTPMNAIIGFTTLAVSNIDNQERVQDYLGKILSSSNHLLSLINDILDMSRIESGKIHLEETEVSLSDVLHDLKTIISGQIHAKQLELYMDVMDVTNEDVYCDKTRLNQVLLNLLSNAVKFTPAGGTVSVRLKQYPKAVKGSKLYEIRVKDTGIGMSQEFVQKIFSPFERERTSTVSRTQGTGLGMAITKNIVDMMGGTIEVQTEQGKGTEFIVCLPLRIQSERQRIEKIAELEGLKALVVDDDFNTCDSVTKMLVRVGMRSEWTLSGKEAVLRARQSMELGDAFHAYIIDWRLPDMNGIEVTRQIRSLGDDTPIIILTAYDWSDIEAEARAAGVTAFCAKPLFMSDIRDTLMTAIGQSQAEVEDSILPEAGSDFRGRCILLVEDNELNSEIAVEILKEYGFLVDTAENGAEAVEKVKNSTPGKYDLVLMDVQMPVMNGYEATRQIRALDDPALSGITILAMTANAFDEDRKKALEYGMDGFLSKPIVIEELISTLHNNLLD